MPLPLAFDKPQQVEDYIGCNLLVWEDKYSKALEVCERSFKENPNGITLENLLLSAVKERKKDLLRELETFVKNRLKGKTKEKFLTEIETAKAYLSGNLKDYKRYALDLFREGEAPLFLLETFLKVLNPQKDWELTSWLLFYLYNKNPYDPRLEETLHSLILEGGERSINLLKAFIKYDPRKEYFLWLGQVLLSKGYYAEAVNILKKATDLYPDDKRLKKLLGIAYTLNLQPSKAKKILREVRELPPLSEQEKAFISLNKEIHNPAEREILIKVLKAVYGKSPISLENALFQAYRIGWTASVLTFGKALEEVLKKPKEDEIPYLTIYWLTYEWYFRKPLPGVSEKKLKKLLKVYPNNPSLLLVEAYNEALKGNKTEVEELLAKIDLKKLPQIFLPVYAALKVYAYGYRDTLLGKPIGIPFAVELLNYLYPLSREKAEEFADRYLQTHHSETAYRAINSIFFYLGDLKLAEKYAREGVERYPNNPDFLNTYAYVRLLREGKKAAKESVEMLKKALRLKPHSPAILDSLGWGYYLMGNYKLAEQYLKKALEISPKDPVENYHYAALLIKEGKPCEAEKFLKQSLRSIYLLPSEPEPGIMEKVKILLEEVEKNCKTR